MRFKRLLKKTSRAWTNTLAVLGLKEPYHPELHYLRGKPGPKWRARYGKDRFFDDSTVAVTSPGALASSASTKVSPDSLPA